MRDLEHGSVLHLTPETTRFVLNSLRDAESFQQTSDFSVIDVLKDKAKAER